MVQNLIREENIELIGQVETNHSQLSQWDIQSCWGQHVADFIQEPAYEGSGGLIISCRKDSFIYSRCIKRRRWISLTGEFLNDHFRFEVCLVYAPNDQNNRRQVWDQLRTLKASVTVPLLLMGDFNGILHPRERRGASEVTTSMREFQELIQDLQLFDLEIGQNFTWLRWNAASRIDRVMIELDFLLPFPRIKAWCKNRQLSDHFAIVVGTT